jgi:hypothetical protein
VSLEAPALRLYELVQAEQQDVMGQVLQR